MQNFNHVRLMIVGIGIAAIGVIYAGTVFASHTFEAGVERGNLPDNTHVRLDGLTLPPGGVMPVYDASPNFVSGHFLLRAPCEVVNGDNLLKRPTVTVIAGHIDESMHHTHMDKIPLFYIPHASGPDSCVWHAHIPDPLNGGAPRVTDIDLVNFSGSPITFNPGDVVDINIQRVLGNIADAEYSDGTLPGDLTHGNPVFNVDHSDPNKRGLGFHGGE
ncbi:MAG: hypothetical protein QXU32_12930 [Nitrososphaerales archaeon]